jgi:hypothetical protein
MFDGMGARLLLACHSFAVVYDENEYVSVI